MYIQGPPTHTVIFHLAIRAIRWCDRIDYLGFNLPLHMDILLYDKNLLIIEPIKYQYHQKSKMKNFALTNDF